MNLRSKAWKVKQKHLITHLPADLTDATYAKIGVSSY